MAEDRDEMLRRLAQGNPVDQRQLQLLEQQLERLKGAGMATVTSGFGVQRPLAHPANPQRLEPLRSNAVNQTTRDR
jgi:hypothetical protein